MGDENPIRTLGDYSKPSHEGYRNTIELLEGNNVVPFRSDTIRLVQNGCSFHGLQFEDPNQHVKDFLKLVDSLDLDGENSERTRLRLFQFSIRDQVSNWLECLPAGSISIWEDLTTRFLAQFFPSGRTAKLRNDILMFQQHHGESLSEAWTRFKDPTQVNKITASCEICNGPHDTHNCMKGPEQACVDYASSHTNEIRDKKFTSNQGPRNFNDTANTWKDKLNFNWERTQTFTNPQNESISVHSSSYKIKLEKALLNFESNQEKRLSHLHTLFGQHQDDMIGKINLLWKTVFEKLNDISTLENAGNFMAYKSIAAISYKEKEELRKKGIKSPSKLFSPKYLSPASIKELNKNLLALKRVHLVNSIIILSTDSDTEEEDTSSTNAHEHKLDDMVRRSEGIKEQGKEDDKIETNMEVEEAIEEEESEFKTNEEVKEVFEVEDEDEDDESFNSFPTMKELSHHEWLLKHPRPSHQYNQIMTYGLRSRHNPSKPYENNNFVGRVKRIKVFIGSFAYECDFIILEDTSSIIDRHLGEMVFEKPFIDKTSLVYDKEKGTVMFEQGDEKITFKMPYTMEIFKQTWLMGLSTDSIPPSAHEENFDHERMHYYQSLLIEDEYKQDGGDRKGIRNLMRLEKEMMDNKGEVTLYFMRKSLEVLRKFHWMTLGG
ncbi:protein kinase-like domain, concanavalin A-like lectin/glucanase domain protein [Tanacetum coccineum]